MKNIICNSFELQATQIIATISNGTQEIDMKIDRAEFEAYITKGTGVIEMTDINIDAVGEMTERPVTYSLSQYWNQGASINNTPIIKHIKEFVTRDAVAKTGLQVEFAEEHLKGLIKNLDPVTRAEAYAFLLEYGMLKKEHGEQSASQIFNRILTSKAA